MSELHALRKPSLTRNAWQSMSAAGTKRTSPGALQCPLLTQSGHCAGVRLGGHTPHKNGAFYPATSDCRSRVLSFGDTHPIGGLPCFPHELRLQELLQLLGGTTRGGPIFPAKRRQSR